jgi:hypothetical protein
MANFRSEGKGTLVTVLELRLCDGKHAKCYAPTSWKMKSAEQPGAAQDQASGY